MSVQQILSIRLDLKPRLFLLGLYPEGHRIKCHGRMFISMCSLQAKRTTALSWKHFGKPVIAVCFRELTSCLPLEKNVLQEVFQKVWGRFINYMKDNDLSHLMDGTGTV